MVAAEGNAPGAGGADKWTRASRWFAPARLGLILVVVVYPVIVALTRPTQGGDAHAYWAAGGSLYAQAVLGGTDAYLYSPAFAQAIVPLQLLPWPAFHVVWAALTGGALAMLLGPIAVPLMIVPPIGRELIALNIHLLIALVVVGGFRRPWLWSFVLLTKVTPGVALLWFAVRGEWKRLAIALAATAIVAAVSAVLAPDLWRAWIETLMSGGASSSAAPDPTSYWPIPLAPRLVAAALVVIWGARTGRPWTVAVSATLAMPVLWIAALSTLAACWPLRRRVSAGVEVEPAWQVRLPKRRPA